MLYNKLERFGIFAIIQLKNVVVLTVYMDSKPGEYIFKNVS